MHRDVDIALLRAFTAVVDTGGVTSAAHALNRTQAAVSLQIKRLEELFDCRLFEREHRRLQMTSAGERLLGDARRLVALNDDLVARLTTPDFTGEIRVGVPTDIVRTYVPLLLRRFNQAFPQVQISLMTGNSSRLMEQYEKGALDLCFTTDEAGKGGGEMLRVERLVWVGAPGAATHLVEPLPIAIGDTTCRFRPSVIDALRLVGRKWRIVLAASSQAAQDAAVAAGVAVSALLRDSIPADLIELGPEAALPVLPDYTINLHAPKSGLNPVVDAFVQTVRQEFIARFGASGSARNGPQRRKRA